MSLPPARDEDFHGQHRRPIGVDPQHLRVINDTALRSRLIMAGIAEGLQSPKGPQRIKSIIRLYPDFDAPRPTNKPRTIRAAAPPSHEPSRAAFGLPTVEELNALLNRIHQTEREVSQQLQGQLGNQIDRLKKQIAALDGDEFERAFRELEAAMKQRRELAGAIREEAFRRIDADGSFEPRRYLRLVSRERS
ncbi:hypothetical protein WPS_21250 [Vulcanimicrobium alpinum]|uniref:Uncharacterized protein n=1 Tax=Vulcanimicrobium alpinum TaxID=3016050 RepID=A0AAN1XXP3_UNVUL|nr:hypothetical protein [Vulcanimicrobium alpinum]BDE06849.1 hypothetical protein WPS_21250 [Vulcanimicrobium alpinum]